MLDSNEFAELWNKLTPTQKRFAVAMQEHPSKKEAAQAIGITPQTAYNFNGEVDDVIDFMTNNIALATLGILQANATKAAMVKAKGLDSKNEKIAQDAASEIIDRNIGKVPQRSEITGADGGALRVKFIDYGLTRDNDTDTNTD